MIALISVFLFMFDVYFVSRVCGYVFVFFYVLIYLPYSRLFSFANWMEEVFILRL